MNTRSYVMSASIYAQILIDFICNCDITTTSNIRNNSTRLETTRLNSAQHDNVQRTTRRGGVGLNTTIRHILDIRSHTREQAHRQRNRQHLQTTSLDASSPSVVKLGPPRGAFEDLPCLTFLRVLGRTGGG